MSFLTDLGTSFNGLVDSLSGKTRQANYSEALTIQEQIAATALANEANLNNLKYNPDLAKQRTIQVALIATPIIIGVLIFIYIKFIR